VAAATIGSKALLATVLSIVGASAATNLLKSNQVALSCRYLFKELRSGKIYIVQSCDIARRLAEHNRLGNFLFKFSDVQTFEIAGGKTAREVFEKRMIYSHGCIDGGSLLNMRNPIGKAREQLLHLFPGLPPIP
jgi:hypothetical protein